MIRKTIGLAQLTQHIRTTTTSTNHTQIVFDQFASGGLKGTTEDRTLDWQYRPHSDWLFGDVKGRSRWNSLAKILEEYAGKGDAETDAKFLCEGWLSESAEGENVVEAWAENEKNGWTAWQVWGFAEIDVEGRKERWHVRRVVVRKGKDVKRLRLCYSWIGELDA